MKIPCPADWESDSDTVDVGRIGKHEKTLLLALLAWSEIGAPADHRPLAASATKRALDDDVAAYERGQIVPVWRLAHDARITSRPVLARALHTLDTKEMIVRHGANLYWIEGGWGSTHTKYVELSSLGRAAAQALRDKR